MIEELYSERESGPSPRIVEEISESVWNGIRLVINGKIDDGSFGKKYPVYCNDCPQIVGCNRNNFLSGIMSVIPGLDLSLEMPIPNSYQILDLIEFCYSIIAKPIEGHYHSYPQHFHLSFNENVGKEDFRSEINIIFRRNSLVYSLGEDGKITRILPPAIGEILKSHILTGDGELDGLINNSVDKFIHPAPDYKKESVQVLWSAFERLKTIEEGDNKRIQTERLLESAVPNNTFRERIDEEMRELTGIGNSFTIRHSETTQTPLAESEYYDYLFHRLFALIWLLLVRTGRCS